MRPWRCGPLRVAALPVPLAVVLVLGASSPAGAEEAADDSAAQPSTLCRVSDPRLAELSGLVVLGDRMLAMNDGGSQAAVYALDRGCRVVEATTAAVDPHDPEDLAVGADGTVWLADIGDNGATRTTVALIALRPDGSSAVHRLTYPDGAHDAEALLLAPDGTPYIVTKEVLGASSVYRPASALVENGTVALTRVAGVAFTLTGTPGGPVGRAGQLMVTGGAVSRDGARIALRTYTDAYVWPLTGPDVAAALAGEPVRVPLPAAPQGEAISFAADDRALVVGSEGTPSDVTVVPVPGTAVAPPTDVASAAAALTDPAAILQSGRSPLTSAVIAAAVAALLVWLAGKLRRRRLD